MEKLSLSLFIIGSFLIGFGVSQTYHENHQWIATVEYPNEELKIKDGKISGVIYASNGFYSDLEGNKIPKELVCKGYKCFRRPHINN